MIDVNKKECHTSKGYRHTEKDEQAPLCNAVLNRNFDIIKLLLSCKNLDVNILNEYEYDTGYSYEHQVNSSLHFAVKNNDIEIVKLLLSNKNINVNLISVNDYDKKTALYIAVENKFIEIIQLLTSFKGIDPNILYTNIQYGEDGGTFIKGNTALYIAVEKENINIIKQLLTCSNLDVNFPYRYILGDLSMYTRDDQTPLELAIEKENIEIIYLLLSNKNIDANHNFNGTALHRAVEKENIDIIYLLLSCKNIDVNLRKNGKTALHMAIEMKNIEIVQLLLTSNYINVNLPTIKRNFILPKRELDLSIYFGESEDDGHSEYLNFHERKYQKRLKEFEEKTKGKKEIEEKDTPLHLAVLTDKIEIVQLLLLHKDINKDAKNMEGKTPYEITTNKDILNLFSFYQKKKS